MTALITRSNVLAVKEETTAGTLIDPIAADFIPMREGTTVSNELETVTTDQLVAGDIGASETIAVGENPTSSYPAYLVHSGVEGQEPEFGPIIESTMGGKSVAAAEYNTVASSTTTVVKVDSGEGASYEKGEALLIKDATNGYSIRNVKTVSTDDLNINYALSVAPGTGVELGKAVLFKPGTENITYSLHHYQAATSSGFYQAISGCRTTTFGMEFPTKEIATFTAEIQGTKYFYNPIRIDATNDDFSVTDDSGAFTGSITQKVYKTPIELADEIKTKMDAAGSDVFTVTYSSTTGKYTIATDGVATLTLTCSAANSVFAEIGFGSIDLTGALTYTAATAIDALITPTVTPAYDDVDKVVVRNSELIIGDQDEIACRKATNISFNIATPVTDVLSICATNGVSENLTLSREATFSATIILAKYEAKLFDDSINNNTTSVMCNLGPKTNDGNWTPGQCINIYMENAKLTSTTVAESDGYHTMEIEASGFVSGDDKDIFINFI